jgi:hypothetical protein
MNLCPLTTLFTKKTSPIRESLTHISLSSLIYIGITLTHSTLLDLTGESLTKDLIEGLIKRRPYAEQ